MPLVVQYNKRDLPRVLEIGRLRTALGVPAGVPEVSASAKQGEGVFETFKAIVKACMSVVGDPRDKPEGRSVSILPQPMHSSMFPVAAMGPMGEDAAAEYATRMGIEVPKAPRIPSFDAVS
jgi:hypothetical protein